jgi:hypothetical protein
MAIVITILGLLVASVTAGAALIEQARIRGVISEMQEMQLATMIFQQSYDYLPGDFPHASLHWGIQVCAAEGTTGTYGANGNGDNIVEGLAAAQTNVRDQISELHASWCHLYEAGLIKQKIIPLNHYMTSKAPVAGVNAPKVRALKNNATYMLYPGKHLPSPIFGGHFFGEYEHALLLIVPTNKTYARKAALTPKQAYAIDKKLDDGKPLEGNIQAQAGYDLNANDCVENLQYNLGNKNVACTIGTHIRPLW